ncbi:MAG: apolipoprotein N-acyltransferase [Nautiliaceae bacterium]
MKQVNLVDLQQPVLQRIRNSCKSFFKRYFNTNSLITAILFSLPIYLSSFGENYLIKFLNSFISVTAFYWFLNKKHSFFQTGFFIGMFWFWWIALSFRYYGLSFLIPVIILGIAAGYGSIFWFIDKIFSWLKKYNTRLQTLLWAFFLIFGFDYIKPFTFDWLKPEVLIANSFFSPLKITLFLLITAIVLKNKLSLILITIALFIHPKPITPPPLKINLITTYIPQDKKWNPKYIPQEIKNNFKDITNSIGKYDAVVLPESAFPIFLNKHPNIINKLKLLSYKITIITGGLHLKNGKFYNSTYIFEKGNMKILDKHILVPFGEYIPLPFFQKEINKIFFEGASDYATSKHFSVFKIKNTDFINAICYEATVTELYKIFPKYVIALSNLAWFEPSIAGTLQKLLITVYAKRYGKKVFHSINYYPSYTIN